MKQEIYKRAKKEANRTVSKEKGKWLEEWTDIVEGRAKGIMKVLYSTVKKKRMIYVEIII